MSSLKIGYDAIRPTEVINVAEEAMNEMYFSRYISADEDVKDAAGERLMLHMCKEYRHSTETARPITYYSIFAAIILSKGQAKTLDLRVLQDVEDDKVFGPLTKVFEQQVYLATVDAHRHLFGKDYRNSEFKRDEGETHTSVLIRKLEGAERSLVLDLEAFNPSDLYRDFVSVSEKMCNGTFKEAGVEVCPESLNHMTEKQPSDGGFDIFDREPEKRFNIHLY